MIEVKEHGKEFSEFLDREQAKKGILDLFDTYETLDYGDRAAELRLDLERVVEIVDELKKEGEVEVVE